jgi:hypothetical protein
VKVFLDDRKTCGFIHVYGRSKAWDFYFCDAREYRRPTHGKEVGELWLRPSDLCEVALRCVVIRGVRSGQDQDRLPLELARAGRQGAACDTHGRSPTFCPPILSP